MNELAGAPLTAGFVIALFDRQGNLLNQNLFRRIESFLNELMWMSRVARYDRGVGWA